MFHDRNKTRRLFDRSKTRLDQLPARKLRQVQEINRIARRLRKNPSASAFQQDE